MKVTVIDSIMGSGKTTSLINMMNENTEEKFIYISIPDVRYWENEWFSDILCRTMKYDKDWTGGQNHRTTLFTFTKDIENLYK